MTRVPIDDIVKGRRYRREMGDLQALADSIRTVGLLHPPVVVHDRNGYRLVAGERRLAAVQLLGWDDVPVTIAVGIADAKGLLAAERDENTCRLDFAPSEAVALAKRIEELERPRAQANSAANLIHRRSGPSAQVGQSERVGRVADVAAAATGLGRETIRKAAAVVDATTDPDPVVQAAAQAAVEQMDTTGKVDPAYRAVNEARDTALAPAGADDEAQTIVLDGHNWTPSRRRGLDVAHGAALVPVRIGMGMWDDDGPPIITSAAADWLVGHGYLSRIRVKAGQKWVKLTPAGSDAWDRLHGLTDPAPDPEPEPSRPRMTPEERHAEVLRLHATGRGPGDIADELELPRTTVLADLEPTLATARRVSARTVVCHAARQLVDALAVAEAEDAARIFDADAEDGMEWLDEIDRAYQVLARLREAIQAHLTTTQEDTP